MTSNTRAQRLIDEFEEAASFYEGYSVRHGIAAVLWAAADQVVPPDPCGDDCCIDLAVGIRADFLSIAAELEALDD